MTSYFLPPSLLVHPSGRIPTPVVLQAQCLSYCPLLLSVLLLLLDKYVTSLTLPRNGRPCGECMSSYSLFLEPSVHPLHLFFSGPCHSIRLLLRFQKVTSFATAWKPKLLIMKQLLPQPAPYQFVPHSSPIYPTSMAPFMPPPPGQVGLPFYSSKLISFTPEKC